MVLPAKPALPFFTPFLHWFSDLLFNTKRVIKTHPQPRAVKRLRQGGVKPLKLKTITPLSAVFPKAQILKVKPKRKPKSEAAKDRKKSTLKNEKEQDHEKPVRVSILVPNRDQGFAVFWPHFWALGHLGTNMVPKSPPRAPRTAPDLIFCRFRIVSLFIFKTFWHHKIQRVYC